MAESVISAGRHQSTPETLKYGPQTAGGRNQMANNREREIRGGRARGSFPCKSLDICVDSSVSSILICLCEKILFKASASERVGINE